MSGVHSEAHFSFRLHLVILSSCMIFLLVKKSVWLRRRTERKRDKYIARPETWDSSPVGIEEVEGYICCYMSSRECYQTSFKTAGLLRQGTSKDSTTWNTRDYMKNYVNVIGLAPVVQKVDNAIHQINHYPLDMAIGFAITYPVDSDLSGG